MFVPHIHDEHKTQFIFVFIYLFNFYLKKKTSNTRKQNNLFI